jgi:hypothetical protein
MLFFPFPARSAAAPRGPARAGAAAWPRRAWTPRWRLRSRPTGRRRALCDADVCFYLRAADGVSLGLGALSWEMLLRVACLNPRVAPASRLSLSSDAGSAGAGWRAAPMLLDALRGAAPLPGLSARVPACVGDMLPQARAFVLRLCAASCVCAHN